eukprot:1156364-Pelagomonas_calceolata.AAC.3
MRPRNADLTLPFAYMNQSMRTRETWNCILDAIWLHSGCLELHPSCYMFSLSGRVQSHCRVHNAECSHMIGAFQLLGIALWLLCFPPIPQSAVT